MGIFTRCYPKAQIKQHNSILSYIKREFYKGGAVEFLDLSVQNLVTFIVLYKCLLSSPLRFELYLAIWGDSNFFIRIDETNRPTIQCMWGCCMMESDCGFFLVFRPTVAPSLFSKQLGRWFLFWCVRTLATWNRKMLLDIFETYDNTIFTIIINRKCYSNKISYINLQYPPLKRKMQ